MVLVYLASGTDAVPDRELHLRDVIIGALGNPEVIRQVPGSQAYLEVARRYNKFSAMAQGYISAFPEDRRDEVHQFLGNYVEILQIVFYEVILFLSEEIMALLSRA